MDPGSLLDRAEVAAAPVAGSGGIGLSGLALIGSVIALATGRKPQAPAVAEVLPSTGASAGQAKAA